MTSTDLGPAEQAILSREILDTVATGTRGETLRVHRSRPVVAFGRQDVVSPGYREARAAAESLGYEAIERLAGGRAAVFHEGTLAFAWAIPTKEPRGEIESRFRVLAEIMRDSFRSLGVDARIGEVPREYCPGSWSVNGRGRVKLMGVGQRLVRGAAHVGGVVVVSGENRIRSVLRPVYAAMDLGFDPSTAGSIETEAGVSDLDVVSAVIVSEFGKRFALSTRDRSDPYE